MRKQRGVTMIGWIFLLVPVAIVLFAAIRVGPEYYEYYKLISAVKSTASELQADETLTPQAIRGALQRRFDTSYVDNVKSSDLEVLKVENGWEVNVDYDKEVPLFGNIHLLLVFSNSVPIT